MHGPQGSAFMFNKKKQSSSTKLVRCREWGLDHIGHQENVHVYKQQYFYCLIIIIIIYKDYEVYVLYDTVWDPGDEIYPSLILNQNGHRKLNRSRLKTDGRCGNNWI